MANILLPKISQSQRSVRAGVTFGTCHCEPIHSLICICKSSIIFQDFHLNHYKLLAFITITLECNKFNISYKTNNVCGIHYRISKLNYKVRFLRFYGLVEDFTYSSHLMQISFWRRRAFSKGSTNLQ